MLHQFLLVWVSARLVRHTYSELHSLTSFERHRSIFHPKTTIALEYYRVNSIAIGWLLHKVAVLNYCTPTSIWMNNQDSIATAYSFTSNYLCCYLSPSGVVYSVRIVLKYFCYFGFVNCYSSRRWLLSHRQLYQAQLQECMRYHMTVISDHTVNQNRFSLVVIIISQLLMLSCCSAPCRIGPHDGWCHWMTHQ